MVRVRKAVGRWEVSDDITPKQAEEKSDPKADVERVNIIMVATKKEYFYNGDNDYQSILTWIYNIPADQRALFHTLTLIR